MSVIIPIYNVENYLRPCVDSILNQTHTNLEIILVEDGSPDGCANICDEYQLIDERVKVIHKKNGGAASARKAGMDIATGKYVMFVDGDDWIELNTIEICIAEVIKRPELGCVLFSYVKETASGSVPMSIMDQTIYLEGDVAENKVYRRLFGLSNDELNHPERMENMVSCCMKLYRSDFAEKGRYYDVKEVGSCEDGLFNMYALYKCESIMYLDMPMYHYRKIENSATNSYRPRLVQQWGNLFSIMEKIIDEKKLGAEYREALANRIALSITAIGLNEIRNPVHGKRENIKVIKNYLNQERFYSAVSRLEIKNMPLVWKLLMISCKLKCAIAVYVGISIISLIRKR